MSRFIQKGSPRSITHSHSKNPWVKVPSRKSWNKNPYSCYRLKYEYDDEICLDVAWCCFKIIKLWQKEQYLLKNIGMQQKYSNCDKKEQYLLKNIGMQHLFILLWPLRALNLDQQLPNSFHRIHAAWGTCTLGWCKKSFFWISTSMFCMRVPVGKTRLHDFFQIYRPTNDPGPRIRSFLL